MFYKKSKNSVDKQVTCISTEFFCLISKEIRDLIGIYLSNNGYSVIKANSGDGSLKYYKIWREKI